MRWLRRKPPVLQMGDAVRVKASGQTYMLRLSSLSVDIHRGASAELVSTTPNSLQK